MIRLCRSSCRIVSKINIIKAVPLLEVYKQVVADLLEAEKVFEECVEEVGVAGGYSGNEINVESCVPVYV